MLQRRLGRFTSRVVVPADIRGTIDRDEITRALRTQDPKEAARRLALWETHVGAYFAAIRRHGAGMTRAQLDQITRRYLAATFDEIEGRLALEWDEPGLDAHRFDLNDEAHRLSGLLANAAPGEFLAEASALLPEAEPEVQRQLARRLIEAKLEALKAELSALSGEALRRPPALQAPSPITEVEPKETPRVSEVARAYGDERVRLRKWSAKTELQNRTVLALVAELLGDPQMGLVTKADIRQLGTDVAELPSNMTKRFPGVPAREVLKQVAGTKTQRLEPRSVNKYQQLARSLFAWATEHDVIPQNPAAILKDVKEPRAKDDRLPFTDEDLVAYFATLDKEPKRPELYWMPRILAYSGMRLKEAAQLTKGDIRQEAGVWVFDVNEGSEGKRLKTEASRRLVPVHPRLLEMGLLEFLKDLRGEYLIAAEWRTTDNPTRGEIDKLSKLLNRRLREAGIVSPKKTGAHSFRHTVAARLQRAGVPEYQIADVLGHENESVTTGRYGATSDVLKLAEVVGKLELLLKT